MQLRDELQIAHELLKYADVELSTIHSDATNDSLPHTRAAQLLNHFGVNSVTDTQLVGSSRDVFCDMTPNC